MENIREINEFLNTVITVANKFINKVETGQAHSVETYSELKIVKGDAERLRDLLNPNEDFKPNDSVDPTSCNFPKVVVYIKDPDVLIDALEDSFKSETFGLQDEVEIEAIRAIRKDKAKNVIDRWVEYGEYYKIEFDIDKETATVIPANNK